MAIDIKKNMHKFVSSQKEPHNITKIEKNANMDSTTTGSVNDCN